MYIDLSSFQRARADVAAAAPPTGGGACCSDCAASSGGNVRGLGLVSAAMEPVSEGVSWLWWVAAGLAGWWIISAPAPEAARQPRRRRRLALTYGSN